MDQEIIKYIAEFLAKFYIWEIIIILIAITLTGLLKLPIKKKSLKLQKKYGVDKSILTWVNGLIPYALCLIMCFILFWYKSGWSMQLDILDWSSIITEGILLGSGAIGLYEVVKKIVKGHKAIQEKKQTKTLEIKKQESRKSKYRL